MTTTNKTTTNEKEQERKKNRIRTTKSTKHHHHVVYIEWIIMNVYWNPHICTHRTLAIIEKKYYSRYIFFRPLNPLHTQLIIIIIDVIQAYTLFSFTSFCVWKFCCSHLLFDHHHHQCNLVHSLHKITRNILMMMIQLVIQTKQNGRIVCVFLVTKSQTHIYTCRAKNL